MTSKRKKIIIKKDIELIKNVNQSKNQYKNCIQFLFIPRAYLFNLYQWIFF